MNWPTGLGGKGNDGVAGLIKQQKGAIGYVELIYAVKNHLAYGKVQNKQGEFVKADLKSVTAAAAALKSMPADFRVSITNESGAGVYPISTFTWLLVPGKIPECRKKEGPGRLFKVGDLTTGQNSVEALDYAKLPRALWPKKKNRSHEIQ